MIVLDSHDRVFHRVSFPNDHLMTREGTCHQFTAGRNCFGRFEKSPSDFSMSRFTQENLSPRTLEFTLESSRNTERISPRNITGTSQSIASHFKAERSHHMPEIPVTSIQGAITQREEPAIISSTFRENSHPPSAVSDDLQPLYTWRENNIENENQNPVSIKRPLEDVQPSPSQARKRRKLNPYFGNKELRAVDVMFTRRDQDLTDDGNITVDHPKHLAGERLYVQGLVRKLFLNPDILEFPHDESHRTVWKLHSLNLVKKHEQHTALVFDTNSSTGECNVFQGAVATLGIPEQTKRRPHKDKDEVIPFHWDDSAENQLGSGGDWDYLNKWTYMKDDKLLPVFLESDEEDAVYGEATIREMEAEERHKKEEQAPIGKAISVDIVRRIIEEELTTYHNLSSNSKRKPTKSIENNTVKKQKGSRFQIISRI